MTSPEDRERLLTELAQEAQAWGFYGTDPGTYGIRRHEGTTTYYRRVAGEWLETDPWCARCGVVEGSNESLGDAVYCEACAVLILESEAHDA